MNFVESKLKQWKMGTKTRAFMSAFLYFFGLLFLDFSFRYLYRFVSPLRFFQWEPICFTVGWCFLLTAICTLLPRALRRIMMVLTGLFYSVLVLVHAGMFGVFGSFFSFSSLGFAGDGAAFFSWDYIKIRKLLLLFVLFSFLLTALAAYLAPNYKKGKGTLLLRFAAMAVAALSVGLLFYVHGSFAQKADFMTWDVEYTPDTREIVYDDFTDVNTCMQYTGLYQFTFRDFCVTNGIGASSLDNLKFSAYFKERKEKIGGENDMTGVFAGKNFMMVMLESIDIWMLRPEYMPNLYALQENGINFANHYTPIYLYGATFNTEIMSLTGQIPTATNLPSSAYARNSFPTALPALFQSSGYRVNSFHSASPTIYNRGTIHENLGFEKYWSWTDMGMEDYMLDSQMLNGYGQMVSEEPFFDFIITYSGHGPYTDEMGNISAPHMAQAQEAVAKTGVYSENPDTMEQYIRAIAHAMETDAWIGGLVEQLRADGHMEDTVLLFYTDHYGKYLTDTAFIKTLKGVTADREEELYHTPCILYAEGQESRVITKYTSTVDLAPTIANLFSLIVEREYYAGDDAFGDAGGFVMLPNYSWFNGEVTSEESRTGTEPEISARSAEVRERINMSQGTFIRDYFSAWEKQ